jgi:hypothetical protein
MAIEANHSARFLLCAQEPDQGVEPMLFSGGTSSANDWNEVQVNLQTRSTQDPLKIHSRSIQDPPKIHSRSTQDPFKTHSRSTQDPLKIHSRSTQDPLKIHSRSTQDPLKIHSRSTQDPPKIHPRSTQDPPKNCTSILNEHWDETSQVTLFCTRGQCHPRSLPTGKTTVIS